MDNYRNKTRKVQIGDVCIGGGEKIAIQSMTNTKTEDVEACVAQILRLEKAGCDIIRVAVPTMEAAESISKIKKHIHIPLVADIHFDYRLAIAAIENGADKIRINPGNIGDEKRVRAVVEKAKEYIYQGDIFQVVLSNRLEAEYEGSLLNTYRIMRTTNPSPYMFYFSSDDMEVAGASPETLVKLENGVLHTFPLAGTRPRGKDRQEDLALEKDLLADEKECAEHNMLVDLGRNDIGKISKYGTVEVEEYMQVLRYSHVMHIGSTVRGQIRDDKTALDAVEAVLPAGTLSGAPKYRAMEIINELENNKRGIYGGAVGYLDFTGNLDTCIGIRLAYKKNGKVFVRSGAGIVADSIPEKEFQECINKAKAVVEAIKKAQQMAAYEGKENDDDTID